MLNYSSNFKNLREVDMVYLKLSFSIILLILSVKFYYTYKKFTYQYNIIIIYSRNDRHKHNMSLVF